MAQPLFDKPEETSSPEPDVAEWEGPPNFLPAIGASLVLWALIVSAVIVLT